jgi:hypothetical protein
MLDTIKPISGASGLKKKLTNTPTQKEEHVGHNKASRTSGIRNITFLRI